MSLLTELRALAFHQRRKRWRTCHNADGTPKVCYATRRRANRRSLKFQHAYRCDADPRHGWHLATTRKVSADMPRRVA